MSNPIKKIGIIGAGMMGKGIAYCAAKAGVEVLLKDTQGDVEQAIFQYCEKIYEKEHLNEVELSQIKTKIKVVSDYQEFTTCTLVIEAAFEDRKVKNEIYGELSNLPSSCLVASNTSTLPISSLAAGYAYPENFLGLHFFSPVPRMKLVEIIKGEETSQEALELAKIFVHQLNKVPIIVGDGRGFFTTRVFQTYVYEGMYALSDGVAPELIEEAGKSSGMPVGPLALADEVSLELLFNLNQQLEKDTGKATQNQAIEVLKEMVISHKRLGRKNKAGFYEYTAEGKHLWSGLPNFWAPSPSQPTLSETEDRLIYIQCLESLRAKKEGVLLRDEDADTGSKLGLGFPQEKVGTLGYISQVGAQKFFTRCRDLAQKWGPRFDPTGLENL